MLSWPILLFIDEANYDLVKAANRNLIITGSGKGKQHPLSVRDNQLELGGRAPPRKKKLPGKDMFEWFQE